MCSIKRTLNKINKKNIHKNLQRWSMCQGDTADMMRFLLGVHVRAPVLSSAAELKIQKDALLSSLTTSDKCAE
jgi:hypothetical protein